MKIFARSWIIICLILIQMVSTLPYLNSPTTLDIPQAEIIASDVSTNGQFLAVMTTNMELRLYKINKQAYVFLNKASSCEGNGLSIFEDSNKESAIQQDGKLFVTVKCKSGNLLYEFSEKANQLNEITVGKIMQESLKLLQNKIQDHTSRLLQTTNCSVRNYNGTNGTNSTNGSFVCGDGNLISGDGCSANCTIQFCGDAIVNNNGTQQCDVGNNTQSNGCVNCKLTCGDGIQQSGQECDDGNTNNGDGCDAYCKRQTAARAVPLAVGIPLAVAALVGIIVAKCAMGGHAAHAGGAAYVAGQPGQVLQIEQTTKIMRGSL